MLMFIAVVLFGIILIGQAILNYRAKTTIGWLELFRAGIGAYWIFASMHTLFLYDPDTLYECFYVSNQLVWPGVLLTLAITVASNRIIVEKAKAGNGNA